MPKLQFFPIDVTYKVVENKAVIYMYGRTKDGKQVCVIDEDFEPYFYVIPKPRVDINALKAKIKELKSEKNGHFEVLKTETVKKTLGIQDKTAIKVVPNLPKGVPALRELIQDIKDVEEIIEYDILFARRYLIDKKIIPLILTDVEAEQLERREKSKVPIFKALSISQTSNESLEDPRILAFDIETYNPQGKSVNADKHPIIMIALYGEKFKKVITWKRFKTKADIHDHIEFVENEERLLIRFKELIEEYSPDILTGYYSDGFDFPYILKRAEVYRLKLDISLDHDIPSLGRGSKTSVETKGIVHIDILNFIRRVISRKMRTDSFSLDNVANELLGEEKDDVDIERLAEYWDSTSDHLSDFAKYNLKDAKLTYDLCEKVLPNLVELVKLIGQTLNDLNKMSFSQLVEWYLMRRASEFDHFIPNRPSDSELRERMHSRVQGAFVFEPKPGLYDDIVVFDFRSLYPSIIVSHNISIETLNCDCCKDKEKVPIDGFNLWFCRKKKGFFSTVLEDIITRRIRVKEIMKTADPHKKVFLDARQESLKVLSNSFYGYLGFFGARWYAKDCARSVTAYGRHYIHKVIDGAQAKGFDVLYSDTDSVFLHLKGKSVKEAKDFAEAINANLPGMMELEYEGAFPRALFVAIKEKDSESGAKKKYALIDDKHRITIKGFEMVRRNVSTIAKRTQEEVIRIILEENDKDKAVNYVKDVIDSLKAKKAPTADLIIHTVLSKSIEEYDSVGPHVAAAKLMRDKGIEAVAGSRIEYVIVSGKDKIRDRIKLPQDVKEGEYDADYYINNQVIPAIEKIIEVLGVNIQEMVDGKKQSRLGEYF